MHKHGMTDRQKDQVYALLRETYWADQLPRQVFETSVANSLCRIILHKGEVVGFARAVTDHATFTWICDVVVAREHRGKGLGTRLVSDILAHPDVAGAPAELRTRDAHGFYIPLGFNPEVCMVWRPK